MYPAVSIVVSSAKVGNATTTETFQNSGSRAHHLFSRIRNENLFDAAPSQRRPLIYSTN
jgi:hypothetical protein